eukprot:CAMPEP_0169192140 /NCGR_PEP_ID=MMETSP1016-20121227/5447_1 /TAXON_ID=342587 /ORGANISM="Karlodinium micrum, Strain CCMP2283" /LENGTH=600 /DNA_ID=CAMNT_0009268443 /DNA_START=73 /DNA_END=1875 /DNA_ORIENTATION=-
MNGVPPQYMPRMDNQGYYAPPTPSSIGGNEFIAGGHELLSMDHRQVSLDSEQYGRRCGSSGSFSALSNADSVNAKLRSSQQRGVHFMEGAGNTMPLATRTGSAFDHAIAPLDAELTAELDTCSPSLTQAQLSAIEEAHATLSAFLQQVCSSCSGANAAEQSLLPLGAYALGVTCPGDTLDFVYLVPQQVVLRELLAKLQSALQGSTEASLIRDASAAGELQAPGLQLTWRGVKIVLLLARSIPDLPLASGVGIVQDTAGALSLEVCEAILKPVLVRENFTQLLRFVRFWAKRRGIYGSEFGYFSGTAWAICCAVVCQQHQRLQLPQLVGHFFRTLSRWDWAVPLAILPADGRQPQVELLAPEESPMPVLLPAGSGLIASWSVTPTTMKILQKELRRGFKTVKQVELGRVHWSDVYNSARFFQRHRHYLEFAFMASSQEVFNHWCVWAKKQVQTIVRLFEITSNNIVSLRPWPEWLTFKDAKWSHAHAIFIGLHLERGKDGQNDGGRRSFDLREPIVKFLEATACWPDAETYTNQFELEIRHVKNDQLQTWLENREKGLFGHGQSTQLAPMGGLQMQTLGEKISVCDLPLGDEPDPAGDSM